MSKNSETDAFYREVDDKHLVPLWNITSSALPAEPQSPVKAHLWRWADLRRLAHRAGDLVPIERGGERRVLGLVNPGLGGQARGHAHAVGRGADRQAGRDRSLPPAPPPRPSASSSRATAPTPT